MFLYVEGQFARHSPHFPDSMFLSTVMEMGRSTFLDVPLMMMNFESSLLLSFMVMVSMGRWGK